MEQVEVAVKMFEDRLTGRSWAELSRMLDGAPGWRTELSSRWADRPDWAAFLEWEKWAAISRMLRRVLVRVGCWQAYVERLDEDRAIVDWVRAGGGLVRRTAVRRGGRWVWADEFQDSEIQQAIPPEGLRAVLEAARWWLAGPVPQAEAARDGLG